MKPSNVSLMKLPGVSSRFLLRKSVKSERRCFVTILNPSAPKVKRLQRNSGLEAQTPSVESEKISLLKKALEDFNLETQTLASHEASTITEEVQDLKPQDVVTGTEVNSVSVSEKVEQILTDDLPTIPISENTSQKDTDDNITQVEPDEAPAQDSRAELKSEEESIAEGSNLLLTKEEEPAAESAKALTADHEDDDSSSSDSDSSSSSSSSESENDERKPTGRTRLDQVDSDSNPTLIQC